MDAALLIALLMIVCMIFVVYRKYQHESMAARQRLSSGGQTWTDDDPISFAGMGTLQTIRALHLDAGRYRLCYWFPEAVTVKVELIRAASDERETILLKSGEGEAEFSVASSGAYVLQVTPAAETAEWELEINRLANP